MMNIANSTAGNNTTTGIQAGGGTNASVVRLAGVSIFSNAVNGLVVGTNGSIISFGNNYNSGNGAPTSTIAPQSGLPGTSLIHPLVEEMRAGHDTFPKMRPPGMDSPHPIALS